MYTERCPYCKEGIEIDHDDGYGYGVDEIYQQECPECGKLFTYTTEATYIHYLKRVPCLNGERDHNYKETHTIPRFLARMRCTMCGDERPLPKETYEEYKKEYGEMK